MQDLRNSIHRQHREYQYTKEEMAHNIKWMIRLFGLLLSLAIINHIVYDFLGY